MATNFEIQKQNIFQKIGAWFEGLFNEGVKLYNSLPPDVQQSLVNGSGITAIIAKNINQPANLVTALVQKLYPTVDPAIIQGFLEEIQKMKDPNATPAIDLESAVAWAQGYLQQHDSGSFLSVAATDLYTTLTVLFTPETPLEKIIGLGTIVYKIIVQPSEPVYTISTAPPATAISAPATLPDSAGE